MRTRIPLYVHIATLFLLLFLVLGFSLVFQGYRQTLSGNFAHERQNFAHPCHRNRKNGNRFSNCLETISNPLELKTRRQPQTENFVFSRQKHISRPSLQFIFGISRRCFGADKTQWDKEKRKSADQRQHFLYHFSNLYERTGCRR